MIWGRVYGVQGRAWRKPNGETIDQLRKIVNNLSRGIDDRGEILTSSIQVNLI